MVHIYHGLLAHEVLKIFPSCSDVGCLRFRSLFFLYFHSEAVLWHNHPRIIKNTLISLKLLLRLKGLYIFDSTIANIHPLIIGYGILFIACCVFCTLILFFKYKFDPSSISLTNRGFIKLLTGRISISPILLYAPIN